MTKEEVLQGCTINGLVVKLPNYQLDKKTYQEVAKALVGIGGAWKGGKVGGFVFLEDPTEKLESIQGGTKIDIKVDYQFYETPPEKADELVRLADIEHGDIILEPSAGRGAIIKAINRRISNQKIYCYEKMSTNRPFLLDIKNAELIGEDFLKADDSIQYDKIVANPPFKNNQDIDHVLKMYKLLTCGGRLVAITSSHWKHSKNKKEVDFRNWLLKIGAMTIENSGDTFKSSGANVNTITVIIDK